MKSYCKIVDVFTDYATKKPKITLELLSSDIFDDDEFNDLAKRDSINVELTKITKKRKPSQNDMSWVLQKQLAKKLGLGNEELHERMIKEYSEYDIVFMLSEIDPSKYFDYYDILDTRQGQNGKNYTYYKVYIPSRKMTTTQFSRFMDGIIRECEENGIHTIYEGSN
jgi:hypothetical protein